jgi:hypothetical protein
MVALSGTTHQRSRVEGRGPLAGPFGCLGFWVRRLLRDSPRVDAASRGCHTRSRRSKADLHRQGRAPRRLWPR